MRAILRASSRDGLTYHSHHGEGRCQGCLKEASETHPAKQPLKHDSIAEIILSLKSASASAYLADIRFLIILLVGYAGVSCISEVLSITVRDASIFDFFKIYLIMRKNDQYRDGHVSVIAHCSRKPSCPVGITERILSLLPDSSDSCYPIVRGIVNSRHSQEQFHESLV